MNVIAVEDRQRIRVKEYLIAILIFFLPAANNFPGRAYYYLTNLQNLAELTFNDASFINLMLLPTIIMSLLIIIYRIINHEEIIHYCNYFSAITLLTIIIFIIAGTISTIANYTTPGVITNYFSKFISIALLSITFNNLKTTPQLIKLIFMSFFLGCLFPLLMGLYAYYEAWGIPNLSELIFSHFNLIKMYEYRIQTFGNADNTAVFMGMAGVIFFGCILYNDLPLKQVFIYWLGLALVLIHLFILEIRSSFVCFFVITIVMSFVYQRRIFWLYLLVVLTLFLILYFICPDFVILYIKRMKLAFSWSTENAEQSAAERLEAMRIGWHIFMQNYYLGVGPGASDHYINYYSAHQFNIQQGVELGYLGFFSSILLCLLAIGRFIYLAIQYLTYKIKYEKIIFAAVSAFYFLDAIIANVPTTAGILNTWIALAIIMLLLSDCREFI